MLQWFLYSKPAQGSAFCVLVVALGIFWMVPFKEEQAIIQDSTQRLDSEQLTVQRMTVDLDKTRDLANRYEGNLKEMEYFRSAFLKQKEERLVQISRFLDERARARGVRLESVHYQTAPSREQELEVQSIDLPLVGRYRDIRAFIGDVEASDLFLIITELSLERESGNQGAVSMQLSLATYFEGAPS